MGVEMGGLAGRQAARKKDLKILNLLLITLTKEIT